MLTSIICQTGVNKKRLSAYKEPPPKARATLAPAFRMGGGRADASRSRNWNTSSGFPSAVASAPSETLKTVNDQRSVLPFRHRHFVFAVTGDQTKTKRRITELRRAPRCVRCATGTTDADNLLRATVTVNKVPSSGKIVMAEFMRDQRPMVKLEYRYKTKTETGNLCDQCACTRMTKKAVDR